MNYLSLESKHVGEEMNPWIKPLFLYNFFCLCLCGLEHEELIKHAALIKCKQNPATKNLARFLGARLIIFSNLLYKYDSF